MKDLSEPYPKTWANLELFDGCCSFFAYPFISKPVWQILEKHSHQRVNVRDGQDADVPEYMDHKRCPDSSSPLEKRGKENAACELYRGKKAMHRGKEQRRDDDRGHCRDTLPYPGIEEPSEEELFHERTKQTAGKKIQHEAVDVLLGNKE